ncbi:MAG: hypothetical protein AAF670_10355 [Planctomycetota bacterium]
MIFRTTHHSRRNARFATVGTAMVLGGFWAGGLVGVGKLQRAMTAMQPPQSMTCIELVQNGVGDTSIIRLVDATVHKPAPIEPVPADEVTSTVVQRVQTILAHPKVQPWADRLVRGHITPTAAVVRETSPKLLQLGMGRHLSEVAFAEADRTGELVVHATPDITPTILVGAMDWLELDTPPQLRKTASMPSFTLHPVSQISPLPNAIGWFAGGVVVMALGLVMCGSASLGRWIILCPVGAAIGLAGVPLRSGRGGRFTRLLASILGLGLMGLGYYLLVQAGGLGQSSGIWEIQVAGAMATATGLAALLGAICNARTQRVDSQSLLTWPNPHADASASNRGEAIGVTAMPSSMQSTPSYCRKFCDPRLGVALDESRHQALAPHTDALKKCDFEPPLYIDIGRSSGTSDASVQAGCRNVVLATTERVTNQDHFRLMSVLENGHVVITMNEVDPSPAKSLSHDSATLTVLSQKRVGKVLEKHLAIAAEVGESTGTQLVPLESNEWREIIGYCERCLADVLHQHGEENWDIGAAEYGRFAFPLRPVAIEAAC